MRESKVQSRSARMSRSSDTRAFIYRAQGMTFFSWKSRGLSVCMGSAVGPIAAADRAGAEAGPAGKGRRGCEVESLESRTMFSIATAPGFHTSVTGPGLSWISQMDFAPDGRLFVAQQISGVLDVIKNGAVSPNPVLTLTTSRGDERA